MVLITFQLLQLSYQLLTSMIWIMSVSAQKLSQDFRIIQLAIDDRPL